MKRLAAICIFLLFSTLPLLAEEPAALRGVALVIGQSDYRHIAPLPNPENDARDIEQLLEDLGFDVTGVTDRDTRKLRRDLERFAEDAAGADVAVIYYSGHGIEAGGENWLVPVDADLSALEALDRSLVPLSGILDELRANVPLTVFLIDACRSNPFPPGALARKGGEAVSISGAGLGTPRGFASVEPRATDQVGTIIGFAAEPGLPALDGEPGSNSPYAAAILRHLSAMAGSEFGLVMRMVTEEVYLKTKTRQRPWVNESLRKQLFFGEPGTLPEGEAGIITGERRKLLLTIASLPSPERQQVEEIAAKESVPIDALYGVLAAMGGTGLSTDSKSLETALKSQAAKIRIMLDERKALATDDPELKRLTTAADSAIAEGAIKAARGFLDQAKVVVEKSRSAIENTEAQAKAKRMANAEILIKSAEAAEIDFDHAAAAKDYAAAFGWVKATDRVLAARYKTYEADALQAIGNYRGERSAFAAAIAAYEEALAIVGKADDVSQWGKATNNLANTYLLIGMRDAGSDALNRAAALYREVLSATSQDNDPKAWSITQGNLGVALQALGEREPGTSTQLLDARSAYQAALKARSREEDPMSWAMTKVNIGSVLTTLGERGDEMAKIHLAIRSFEDALKVFDRAKNPVEWAQAVNNLGAAYRLLGARQQDVKLLRKAEAHYRDALTVFTRERMPLDWASANGNLGIALTNIGALEGNMAVIAEAIPIFRSALEELSRERAPAFWAKVNNSYGMTLQVVGQMKSDSALLEQAAAAFRNALSVRRKEINAEQWAESQQLLASTLSALASHHSDVTLSDEAIAAYRAAREVFTRDAFPADWLSVSSGLASALQGKGILLQDVVVLREAETIYKDVLAATNRASDPRQWTAAIKDIATIQFMLGTTVMDRALVELSLRNFELALEEVAISGSFMDRMLLGGMRDNAKKALELFP